jgi:phosphoribosyl-ATP pyrophosphohydrolase|tara:strand:- start:185 stop:502 length:318 start_codon:yes stop_codon:yes gene_type:complete
MKSINMKKLIESVLLWGAEKGLTGENGTATASAQMDKLNEEFLELDVAIINDNQREVIDGIGDMTVVLILLAELRGLRFEDCLNAAYEEIKGRTGKMVDGTFVKD